MKKTYILVAMMWCFMSNALAQQYTHTVKGDVGQTVVEITNLFADDIIIKGVSGNKITIETDDYEGIPEKAKGLKPLSASGPENTGIGLSVQQDGNRITISGASRKADGEYRFEIPKSLMLKIDVNSWQGGDVSVIDMAGEIEAKTQNGDLRFKNITGPIVAYSLSSDIEVDFSMLSQASPTSITSTSGDVDISLPQSTKGDFKMSSVSGEIYTDLEFQFAEESKLKRFAGGMSASATLNGGGVEISLKSVSGDVFIRGK